MRYFLLPVFTILFSLPGVAQTPDRVVLIEQFTNSGCPPCASSTPPVYQFGRNNPVRAAVIAYHTSFPYLDSMHLENPADANARTAFYGVNGVPHSIMDGNHYRAPTASFTGLMQGSFNQRSAVSVRYALELRDFQLRDDSLFLEVRASSLDMQNAQDSLRLYLVIVEDLVLKSSYAASPGANSLNSYSFVMRKMWPDAQGTALINRAMGSDSLQVSWKLHKIKDIDQLRVVAFVQHTTTKEVYQAALTGRLTTSFPEQGSRHHFRIYPNPVTHEFSVRGENLPVTDWEIWNLAGQRTALQQVVRNAEGELHFTLPELENGLYFIRNQNISGYQKLMVQK